MGARLDPTVTALGERGDDGRGRPRWAYPGASWDRLAEVKRRYDRTNLFRHITPAD